MSVSIYEWIRYGLNLFELMACVTGFIYWKKIRSSYWRLFPIYLLVIVCVEVLGAFTEGDFNINLYSYFGIPIQFLFFFWLFHQYFKPLPPVIWSIIATAVYIISLVTELIFLRNETLFFSSLSYTVGNVMLAILVLIFFSRFISSEKILGFKSDMMFWVSLGLLIFYLGSLPFYGLYNTIRDDTKYPGLLATYWSVQMIFNYLMYTFFTISFIWGKPKS
jgi:hypothetical protein